MNIFIFVLLLQCNIFTLFVILIRELIKIFYNLQPIKFCYLIAIIGDTFNISQ